MVVENELSDAQREAADASNDNMTTGITGVPTIVDESPEVVIDEKTPGGYAGLAGGVLFKIYSPFFIFF